MGWIEPQTEANYDSSDSSVLNDAGFIGLVPIELPSTKTVYKYRVKLKAGGEDVQMSLYSAINDDYTPSILEHQSAIIPGITAPGMVEVDVPEGLGPFDPTDNTNATWPRLWIGIRSRQEASGVTLAAKSSGTGWGWTRYFVVDTSNTGIGQYFEDLSPPDLDTYSFSSGSEIYGAIWDEAPPVTTLTELKPIWTVDDGTDFYMTAWADRADWLNPRLILIKYPALTSPLSEETDVYSLGDATVADMETFNLIAYPFHDGTDVFVYGRMDSPEGLSGLHHVVKLSGTSFVNIQNAFGLDYVASMTVIDDYHFILKQNQVGPENWNFNSDPEGWGTNANATLSWDFTTIDALGFTGCLKYVMQSGVGKSPGEASSPVFTPAIIGGANVIFWYMITNDDTGVREFDISAIAYDGATPTTIYIEQVVGLGASETTPWRQISMHVPGTFDKIAIEIASVDDAGDYTFYIDEVAIHTSEFWGGVAGSIALISSVPVKIETPGAMAFNSVGVAGSLFALVAVIGAKTPQPVYGNLDTNFMIVSSGSYDNWDAPGAAAGNVFEDRITALYFAAPCSYGTSAVQGSPTGQVPIVTNTGETVFLPAGEPGQVLTGGGDGQPPVWVDGIDSLPPTKGYLIVGDGSAWVVLGVGSDDKLLVADSNEPAGVKWGEATDIGNCIDGGTF